MKKGASEIYNPSESSPIDYLIPKEVRRIIFTFLPPADLAITRQISKEWHTLSNDLFWSKMHQQYFPYLAEEDTLQKFSQECSRYKKIIKNNFYPFNLKRLLACLKGDLNKVGCYPIEEQQILYSYALANGHNRALQYVTDKGGQALSFAAKNNHIKILTELAATDISTNDKGIVLRWAAKKGHLDIVKHLLTYSNLSTQGTHISPQDKGLALECAARKGHLYIVIHLLQIGTDISNPYKVGAFKEAAKEGHVSIVIHFLQVLKISAKDQGLALQSATENNHLNVVEYILQVATGISEEHKKQAKAKATEKGYPLIAEVISRYIEEKNQFKFFW